MTEQKSKQRKTTRESFAKRYKGAVKTYYANKTAADKARQDYEKARQENEQSS